MSRLKHGLILATLMSGLAFAAAPANAAPAAGQLDSPSRSASSAGAVEQVHFRRWRHCHWRRGERFCHGWRGYGRGPGIYFQFGGRDRDGRRGRRDRDGDDDRDGRRGRGDRD